MAVFRNHPTEWYNLDWTILRNGSASLYWRLEYLEKDISRLEEAGYKVISFDCSSWTDEDKIHDDLFKKIKLPDYYGGNYDALDECLEDIEITGTGLLIAFTHFDSLSKDKRQIIIDIFDRASRFHLLMGNRMINLIQVDEPMAPVEIVKAYPLIWNNREWYDNDRKKDNSSTQQST